MSRRILAAVLLAAMAMACGGTPTAEPAPEPAPEGLEGTEGVEAAPGAGAAECTYDEVFAEVEGLEGQERRDALVAMAEANEGDVNLYTSLNQAVATGVLDAYEEATGLTVSLYRAGSETVRNRVIEEAAAGFAGADVVETNGPELVAMAESGIFQALDSPVQDALVEGATRETWTSSRFNIFTVAWNTDLVAEGEQPTTYADLADPKWDDRMAMEIEDFDWYWAVWNYLVDEGGMSEEEADALFQDMADGAAFTSGHTTMRQLLIAGEYAIITSDYSYGIAEAADAGAPVAWQPPVEPLFARPNGIALVCNAPNPAAALAFTEWYLSDGQESLVASNIDPARADLLDTGDADVRVMSLEDYLAEEQEFIDKYQAVAGAGTVVEG